MEGITRLVDDSLARHGFESTADYRRLEWSCWFRCESSFSLLLVPSAAGIYTLGEEILAPSDAPGGKRMLAVFRISEAEDLCVELSRLFSPRSPLSERLSSGECFVRFAQMADPQARRAAYLSLTRWLTSQAEVATGIVHDVGLPDAVARGDDRTENRMLSNTWDRSVNAPLVEPPPLPGGF